MGHRKPLSERHTHTHTRPYIVGRSYERYGHLAHMMLASQPGVMSVKGPSLLPGSLLPLRHIQNPELPPEMPLSTQPHTSNTH
jgi:hypothetical protein